MCSSSRAFTLIELIIVVAIIAILAATATPQLLQAQTRAKVAHTMASMRSLAVAIESYAVDQNKYPLNGVLVVGGGVQTPQNTAAGAPAHKFLCPSLTTPIAYATHLPGDPFSLRAIPPDPAWKVYYPLYFYTNLDWFAQLALPATPPSIAQKKERYGTWILAAAGPDLDRLDLARDVHYDPTNGTVSDGDVIFSPRFKP